MILRPLVALAAVAPLTAQHVTWAEGGAATSLTVKTIAETNRGSTPSTVLSGIEFLAIEITGRTRQQELDGWRTRRSIRAGLTRVDLPSGGALLAYRRGGASIYGYLWVDDTGRGRVLVERPGSAGANPFVDRIAVAADGRHAAIATGAGELLLARLDGGSYASTGSPVRSVTALAPVEASAVMVGRGHAFFATDDERVWRCSFADNAVPEDVSPPPQPGARVKSELALSGNGQTMVFLYGPRDLYGIWLVGESGAARRLPPPPAKYEDPGYLPETDFGPRMLLNDDGTRLLYTDSTLRDEIYLLDTTGATSTTHVTGDHNFQPYIGIGIIPSFAGSLLITPVGHLERFDVYAATTGDRPVVNLTRTNGNVARPFGEGVLDPSTLHVTGGGQVLFAARTWLGQAWSDYELQAIDGGSGQRRVVASDLARLPQLCVAASPNPDLLVTAAGGDRYLTGALVAPLLVAPAGVELSTNVAMAGGARAFVAAAGSVSAAVVLGLGGLTALPATTGRQAVALAASGALVLDSGDLHHVDRRGVARLAGPAAVRHVLAR